MGDQHTQVTGNDAAAYEGRSRKLVRKGPSLRRVIVSGLVKQLIMTDDGLQASDFHGYNRSAKLSSIQSLCASYGHAVVKESANSSLIQTGNTCQLASHRRNTAKTLSTLPRRASGPRRISVNPRVVPQFTSVSSLVNSLSGATSSMLKKRFEQCACTRG